MIHDDTTNYTFAGRGLDEYKVLSESEICLNIKQYLHIKYNLNIKENLNLLVQIMSEYEIMLEYTKMHMYFLNLNRIVKLSHKTKESQCGQYKCCIYTG